MILSVKYRGSSFKMSLFYALKRDKCVTEEGVTYSSRYPEAYFGEKQ